MFSEGGVDCVTKPFQFEEVRARIETHLHLHRLQRDLRGQVEKQVREISDSQMGMIFALAKLAETRAPETGRHLERIQILCPVTHAEVCAIFQRDSGTHFDPMLVESFLQLSDQFNEVWTLHQE